MANFPLATWGVQRPRFRARLGSVAPYTVFNPDPLVDLYGFGINSASLPIASPTSVAGELAAKLCTLGTAGQVLVVAEYNFTASTVPATSPLTFTLLKSGSSVVNLLFDSLADAAFWGFASTTVSLAANAQTVTTVYNVGAVWCPCGVAGDVRRTVIQRAASSSSDMSGLSTDVVNWGSVANVELLSSMFPAANLTRWYASVAIYATAAGRLLADPNNTLEGLLDAASAGATFRIYRQPAAGAGFLPTNYLVARMPDVSSKGAVADYSSAEDEPRIWSTSALFFRGESS
jgi:hypothetical protein